MMFGFFLFKEILRYFFVNKSVLSFRYDFGDFDIDSLLKEGICVSVKEGIVENKKLDFFNFLVELEIFYFF